MFQSAGAVAERPLFMHPEFRSSLTEKIQRRPALPTYTQHYLMHIVRKMATQLLSTAGSSAAGLGPLEFLQLVATYMERLFRCVSFYKGQILGRLP